MENNGFEILNPETQTNIVEKPGAATIDDFNEFIKIPTIQDGQKSVEVDFEDNPANIPGSTPGNSQPGSPAPGGNIPGGNPAPGLNPLQPQKTIYTKGAKSVIRFVDFLHGILLSFIASRLTPEEVSTRKYRTNETERKEMSEVLAEIFEEDDIRINPKYLILLLFLTIYVEKTREAVVISRKRAKRPTNQNLGVNNANQEEIEEQQKTIERLTGIIEKLSKQKKVSPPKYTEEKRGRGRPKKAL